MCYVTIISPDFAHRSTLSNISSFVRIYISVRAKPASVSQKCFLYGRIKLGGHFLPMNRHMTIAYSNEIDK